MGKTLFSVIIGNYRKRDTNLNQEILLDECFKFFDILGPLQILASESTRVGVVELNYLLVVDNYHKQVKSFLTLILCRALTIVLVSLSK